MIRTLWTWYAAESSVGSRSSRQPRWFLRPYLFIEHHSLNHPGFAIIPYPPFYDGKNDISQTSGRINKDIKSLIRRSVWTSASSSIWAQINVLLANKLVIRSLAGISMKLARSSCVETTPRSDFTWCRRSTTFVLYLRSCLETFLLLHQ